MLKMMYSEKNSICRRLQSQIDQLKKIKDSGNETKYVANDCCSETDTEANEALSDSESDDCCLSESRKSCNSRLNSSKSLVDLEDPNNAVTLNSPLKRHERSPKNKSIDMDKSSPSEVSPKSLSKSAGSQQTTTGRKRARVILSDDEGGDCENETMNFFSKSRPHLWQGEISATSNDS